MADGSTDVSYAEMVRRQAAEDVARWMTPDGWFVRSDERRLGRLPTGRHFL